MARFKYMGEVANQFVIQHGPCLQINIPLKNGTAMSVFPADPVNGFPIGDDIGADITDERSLRFMRNDPRFQEL